MRRTVIAGVGMLFLAFTLSCGLVVTSETPTVSTAPTSAPTSTFAPTAGLMPAVESAFGQWAQQSRVPYRYVHLDVYDDDGTYAMVRVLAQFRESREAEWVLELAEVECRNVGGQWQCPSWFDFRELKYDDPLWREKEVQGPGRVVDQITGLSIECPSGWSAVVASDIWPFWTSKCEEEYEEWDSAVVLIAVYKEDLDHGPGAIVMRLCDPQSLETIEAGMREQAVGVGEHETYTWRRSHLAGIRSVTFEHHRPKTFTRAGHAVIFNGSAYAAIAEASPEVWEENESELLSIVNSLQFH